MNSTALPHEKRAQFRDTIRTLATRRDSLEADLQFGRVSDQAILDSLQETFNTKDPQAIMNALVKTHDQIESSYFKQLKAIARDDLTAFIEFINPDEPPPKHIIWLCDHLERIERREIMRMLLSLPPGHAKAFALDTPLLTTSGWKTIETVQIGDSVFSPRGIPTIVWDKSEVFEGNRVFEVTTDDGATVLADADHIWNVRLCRKHKLFKNYTTLQLYERQSKNKDNRSPLLPDQLPLLLDDTPVVLDPYLLGYWLGDGTTNSRQLTIGKQDAEETVKRFTDRGIAISKQNSDCGFGILDQTDNFKHYNLLGNKHIPEDYFTATIDNRYKLLQGLMDSDGTVSPKGQCFFCNTNRILIDGVVRLLLTLGIKNTVSESRAILNGVDHGPTWKVQFYSHDAFLLTRKKDRAAKYKNKYGRYIRTIKEVQSRPTQCISVDSYDSLFLIGDGLIPTHNSNTCSRYFPAWYLGRNTKHKYLQGGHTQTFCENEFGKPTKAIVDSERFREIFPDVSISTETKAAGTWALAGLGAGKYYTKGVGVGISGFRASCAAIDDPFASREDAESQTIRDKVFDWFSADFTTRLLPNAPMFVVATRWHSDDLIGRVEVMNKEGKGLPWEVINMSALCEDENDPLQRPMGEPLWPDFYTKTMLENLRATLPARDWNSLYRGKPMDAEGSVVDVAWFERYSVLPASTLRKRTVVSVDSAIKDTQRSDFTAIGVWVESNEGKHYLAHVTRERLEFNDLKKKVHNLSAAWNADIIIIEDKGSGTQFIQTEGQVPGSTPVIGVSPNNSSKQFRMDGVTPMIEGGLVHLPHRADWLAAYEDELQSFPTGKYDDQVDMTSQYLEYSRARVGGSTARLSGFAERTGKHNQRKKKVIASIGAQVKLIEERAASDPITRQIREQREAAINLNK